MRRAVMIAAMLTACSGGKQAGNRSVVEAAAKEKAPAPSAEAGKETKAGKETEPGKKAEPGKPDGEDVTAQLLAMNSDEHGAPPTKFRVGHVSRRKPPKVKRTQHGFEVQFASHAPVVTPAVYQGKVYVSGGFRSKEFHAFQATTGKPAWSVTLDDDGPSSAACERGVCVFNTESCTVFAVNSETGKMLWSWWLGDPLTSSPTLAGGRVFTSYPAHGSADPKKPKPPKASHALAAFDLKSGKVLWQKWLDSDVMSAPVAMNGFLYVSTFAGTLIKFEQSTGKIRYAIRTRATSAPVVTFGASGLESTYYTRRGEDEDDVAEEMIIRADHNKPKTKFKAHKRKAKYLDKKVQAQADYAFEGEANDAANGFSGGAPAAANPSAAGGNIGQASVNTMQAFQGSRILHFDDRLVNTMGDEVVATSAETGKKIWSFKLKGDVAKEGGFLGTAPLAAGDSVVVATLKGSVLRLDPKSGKTRAKYSIGARVRSQPVVAGGWIYVGTEDGRLVAIDTGDAKMTGWPMWGGDAARTGVHLAAATPK